MTAEGYGPGEFVFQDLAAGEVTIVARRAGQPLHQQRRAVDGMGSLAFTLPLVAYEPLDLEIRCEKAS